MRRRKRVDRDTLRRIVWFHEAVRLAFRVFGFMKLCSVHMVCEAALKSDARIATVDVMSQRWILDSGFKTESGFMADFHLWTEECVSWICGINWIPQEVSVETIWIESCLDSNPIGFICDWLLSAL